MRILHLCAGNLYGGVERIVAQCAESRALDPSTEVSFGVCFEGRLAVQLRASGADCEVLGDVHVRRPHSVIRARRRLSQLLDRQKPDVAVCHSCWIYGLAAPVLGRHGVGAVPWIHDRLSGTTWVERWASLSRPAAVICNSHYTAVSIDEVFPDVSTHVLYAPVAPATSANAADRACIRRALGADETTPVVLIASRFEAWKGHHELIDALASIPDPWQLWIAGEPQKSGEHAHETRLRELAAARRTHDRVRFLGHRDDLSMLMKAADVLCQPNSAPEPFGIVFVEALAAGLPVVTTALGGAVEIVTDACGVLVKPGDRDGLVHALASLMRDETRRRRLGAAGPARAAALCDPGARLRELSTVLAGVGMPCP